MKRVVILALLLASCGRDDAPRQSATPGARIEAAAVRAGIVPSDGGSIVGSWSRDTDRVCIVPVDGRRSRIGAMVDYGDGQGCAASGIVSRSAGRLDVTFGGCRFAAHLDGDRIVFPAELPGACDSVCTGRASLAALTVDRISDSISEAATLRSAGGKPLCAG